MKFRCPHCQKLLETDEVGKFLCPICKKWSRVPVPKQTAAVEEEEILDVVAAPQESRGSRREAITDRESEERRPRRRRGEEEPEDVELEVVGEDREDRPRRRKRPRRRSSSGGDSILDSINVPLVLLIILAPMGLGMMLLMFLFVNPIAGFASILMVSGWIWFIVIAAEEGVGTVLMVMFVPFYALYYASQNWGEVAIPFLMMIIGQIGLMVGGAISNKNAPGRRMEAPTPIVRMVASVSR